MCFQEKEYLVLPNIWNLPGATLHYCAGCRSAKCLHISVSDLHVQEYIMSRFRNLRTLVVIKSLISFFLEGLMNRLYRPRLRKVFWETLPN
jgi:hypothetical protein